MIILCSGLPGKPSFIVDDLAAALRQEGVQTTLLYPSQVESGDPLPSADVVVLKDKTPAGLALGKRFHAKGVPTITRYPATELCRDKMATNQFLEDAGLPVPASYPVGEESELAPLLEDGPVVLKPIRGSQGRGVTVVESLDEVPPIAGEEMFAQRYYKPDGPDLKVYRIAEEFFCVERQWPPLTLEDKLGKLVKLDDDVLNIARACGDAMGCDVYGVDVIRHGGIPWVVDMSSFPGFKGVPEAGERLARVVMQTV